MPLPWRSGSTPTGPRCECGRPGSCLAQAESQRPILGAARPAMTNAGASRSRSRGDGWQRPGSAESATPTRRSPSHAPRVGRPSRRITREKIPYMTRTRRSELSPMAARCSGLSRIALAVRSAATCKSSPSIGRIWMFSRSVIVCPPPPLSAKAQPGQRPEAHADWSSAITSGRPPFRMASWTSTLTGSPAAYSSNWTESTAVSRTSQSPGASPCSTPHLVCLAQGG